MWIRSSSIRKRKNQYCSTPARMMAAIPTGITSATWGFLSNRTKSAPKVATSWIRLRVKDLIVLPMKKTIANGEVRCQTPGAGGLNLRPPPGRSRWRRPPRRGRSAVGSSGHLPFRGPRPRSSPTRRRAVARRCPCRARESCDRPAPAGKTERLASPETPVQKPAVELGVLHAVEGHGLHRRARARPTCEGCPFHERHSRAAEPRSPARSAPTRRTRRMRPGRTAEASRRIGPWPPSLRPSSRSRPRCR